MLRSLALFRLPPLLLITGGLALASWPVFRWWLARMTDGSDDPPALAALAAAGYFLWQRRRELEVSPYGVWMALGLIVTQAVLPLPPLLRGACLVTALAGALALPKRQAGVVVLLFLSLPVVASLQYFAGFPLRLITAEISRGLLDLLGLTTERTGTLLRWRNHTVGVDAACSGVKLLWSTAFTAAALAARENLPWGRTLPLMGAGLVLVILLNGVRSTILFFPEAHLVIWPDWTHEGVGAGLFLMVAASLVAMANRLGQRRQAAAARPAHPPVPLPRATVLTWVAGILLSAAPAGAYRPASWPAPPLETVEWPTWFEGEKLTAVPLGAAEARFAAGFPGQINVFTSSTGRTILFRRLHRASRGLHSSADCLQAAGYTLHPEPPFQDDQSRLWGTYQVTGPGPVRRVRELITDAGGLTFQDPSSWFWPALLGQSAGPWTAVTVMD